VQQCLETESVPGTGFPCCLLTVARRADLATAAATNSPAGRDSTDTLAPASTLPHTASYLNCLPAHLPVC
jgi:hypothetical protein